MRRIHSTLMFWLVKFCFGIVFHKVASGFCRNKFVRTWGSPGDKFDPAGPFCPSMRYYIRRGLPDLQLGFPPTHFWRNFGLYRIQSPIFPISTHNNAEIVSTICARYFREKFFPSCSLPKRGSFIFAEGCLKI